MFKVSSRNNVSWKGYQAKGDEKRQGEGGGVLKLEKWSDIVYGLLLSNLFPLPHLVNNKQSTNQL